MPDLAMRPVGSSAISLRFTAVDLKALSVLDDEG